MSFTLDTFNYVGSRTSFRYNEETLSALPCGLFRSTASEGAELIPELAGLLNSCPVKDLDAYEFDVKIHMLMPGQYPCVPNWHCDNVPRDVNRKLAYNEAKLREEPPMLLWVSNGPHTEFLARPAYMARAPKDHGEVADFVNSLKESVGDDIAVTRFLPAQQWVSFSSTAPHRGRASDQHQWRVFVRATHKSVLPVRPKVHLLRRHCQVYLDSAKFSW